MTGLHTRHRTVHQNSFKIVHNNPNSDHQIGHGKVLNQSQNQYKISTEINLKISTKLALKSVPKSGYKQINIMLWQSQKIDHNLGYGDLNWLIQNPNIKFTNAATTFMKGTSPNSLRFPTENQSQIWTVCRVKTRQPYHRPKIRPNGPLVQKHIQISLKVEITKEERIPTSSSVALIE